MNSYAELLGGLYVNCHCRVSLFPQWLLLGMLSYLIFRIPPTGKTESRFVNTNVVQYEISIIGVLYYRCISGFNITLIFNKKWNPSLFGLFFFTKDLLLDLILQKNLLRQSILARYVHSLTLNRDVDNYGIEVCLRKLCWYSEKNLGHFVKFIKCL